jgi:chromosome segregation ATPase
MQGSAAMHGEISATDLTKQLNQLTKRREDLNSRQARLQYAREQAQAEKLRLVAEMQEIGTSPETITEDVAKLEQEQEQEITRVQKEFDDFERTMLDAEKSLDTQR